jgi:hypothetical protein
MPKSRNLFSLEEILDNLVNSSYKPQPPPVLYHYTNWEAAHEILISQRIWETAHNCTNDDHELIAAHQVIVEVAGRLQRRTRGTAHRALTLFLDAYERLKINNMKTIYMACFSSSRDEENQWKSYAGKGSGVCLGLRILNEPVPAPDKTGSALLQVDYSQESWRKIVTKSFTDICKELSRFSCTQQNVQQGMSALYRMAAFTSIMAKKPKWSKEREFRHITMFRDGITPEPKKLTRSDGTPKYYLDDVVLREHGKKLAFAEIIIGANQETSQGPSKLMCLLEEAGYEPGSPEYPEITVSLVSPERLLAISASP